MHLAGIAGPEYDQTIRETPLGTKADEPGQGFVERFVAHGK